MKLVDTKEMAEILKVHPHTVRKLVKLEQIPHIKINGRDLRFDVEKVITALEENK